MRNQKNTHIYKILNKLVMKKLEHYKNQSRKKVEKIYSNKIKNLMLNELK